jgi:hypothetical protein
MPVNVKYLLQLLLLLILLTFTYFSIKRWKKLSCVGKNKNGKKKIIKIEKIFENGKKISKYVQDKNWRAYRVSFFSQGSGRVVTSCVVFEQWISAVVLF